MKVTFYTAATIVIEVANKKILCDPWLYGGAFYGSWYHYPPFDFDSTEFEDIDYIYISHTHEDHLCPKSLAALSKNIPVLIHKFKAPFLKNIIERAGFKTIELEHGEPYHLDEQSHFKVFSSQTCAPESEAKQSAIDTFCLVHDGTHTLLNTNDNFIEHIESELYKIKEEYSHIDFLAHVYTSASAYPQMTQSLSEEEMRQEQSRVTKWCYDRSAALVQLLNPRFHFPFAGYYLLGGKLAQYNNWRVNSSPYEAKCYYKENYPYCLRNNECVIFNRGTTFDIKTGLADKEYIVEDPVAKAHYAQDVLSKVKFDYEHTAVNGVVAEINDLLEECYNRMERHRQRQNFTTSTKVFIKALEDAYVAISMCGEGVQWDTFEDIAKEEQYVLMDLDPRLLLNILKGPRYAHWDNADTGSHIKYYKKPNIFERGIYHTICYFHR